MSSKTYEPTSSIGARIVRVQEIKAQINALEAQLDAEKAYLQGHAERHGLQSVVCGPTTLSRRQRITWVYSEGTRDAERKLKVRKQREQDNGIATGKASEHLVITTSVKALVAAQFT